MFSIPRAHRATSMIAPFPLAKGASRSLRSFLATALLCSVPAFAHGPDEPLPHSASEEKTSSPEAVSAPEAVSSPEAAPAADAAAPAAEASKAATCECCEKPEGAALPEGPIAIGYYASDFATAHRVHPRTELGLGTKVGAIIDTPNYYGHLAASALLFGSWAINPSTELFGQLEVFDYQFAQNATIKGTSSGLGQLTAGVARVLYATDRVTGTSAVRLMLPTSMATPHVRVVGLDVSHTTSHLLNRWAELHGFVGGDFSAGLSSGPALPRFGLSGGAGAQLSPWSWLAFALDVQGHWGETSYVGPAIAVRFRAGRSIGGELGATLPLVGTDRHDGLLGLRLSYRLD